MHFCYKGAVSGIVPPRLSVLFLIILIYPHFLNFVRSVVLTNSQQLTFGLRLIVIIGCTFTASHFQDAGWDTSTYGCPTPSLANFATKKINVNTKWIKRTMFFQYLIYNVVKKGKGYSVSRSAPVYNPQSEIIFITTLNYFLFQMLVIQMLKYHTIWVKSRT